MFLVTHILSPNTSLLPESAICGLGSAESVIVSREGLKIKITLSKDTTNYVLYETNDQSLGGTANTGIKTFSDFKVDFVSINENADTNMLCLQMDFKKLDLSNLTTWKKCYITFEIESAWGDGECEKFLNTFEIYGYDIGNTFGNDTDIVPEVITDTPFDIFMVLKESNYEYYIDSLGHYIYTNQTKAYSNFTILRQPFTNNVYFYSMVGGQGAIKFYNDTTLIGSGKSGLTCIDNTKDITIKCVNTLDNSDTCEKELTDYKKIWLPTITTTSTCDTDCNNCINDISTETIYETIDYSLVTIFKINAEKVFLSQYFDESVKFIVYDYTGVEITSYTETYSITYSAWHSNPAPFLVPIDYTLSPPPLGDVRINVKHIFSDATVHDDIIVCEENVKFTVCHWWTVSKGEQCGDYIFNNCGLNDVDIVIQKLNDDKTFDDISTITIESSLSEVITLQDDGIYLIKVPSRDSETEFEYYSIVNFCKIEACWLNNLNNVICNPPKDDCELDNHYNFNAFLINAHSFFIALNEEMNFNYIYTAISNDKINSLYTLNEFITRLAGYCDDCIDTECKPCSNK